MKESSNPLKSELKFHEHILGKILAKHTFSFEIEIRTYILAIIAVSNVAFRRHALKCFCALPLEFTCSNLQFAYLETF